MRSPERQIQALSIIGLLSGLVAVVSIIYVGDTYGLPGSVAYQTYESFNRVMAVLILLESCVIAAYYIKRHQLMGRVEKILVGITLVSWLGMAMGTAAEFWIFSDLPYSQNNMRDVAFGIFSISGLLVGIGLLLLGIWNLRIKSFSWFYGVLFILYLPIDLATFFLGQSIFLVPALFSILLAILNLKMDVKA